MPPAMNNNLYRVDGKHLKASYAICINLLASGCKFIYSTCREIVGII